MPNYFPTSEAKKRQWLLAFQQNLPTVAQNLNLDPREVQEIDAEITASIAHIDAVSQKERELQQTKTARDSHRQTMVKHLDLFVRRLKVKPNYTASDGELLDVETSNRPVPPVANLNNGSFTAKMDTSVQLVTIGFKKPRYASVAIYCRRASESEFSLLRIVKGNSYKDTRSNLNNAPSERRDYYFTLVKDDEDGERSAVFTVAVPQ